MGNTIAMDRKQQAMDLGWVKLPHAHIAQWPTKLTPLQQLVIAHLYDFVKDNFNVCRPCQATIAKRTGVDRTAINKAIASLCKLGILKKIRTRGACLYSFTEAWVGELTQTDVTTVTSRCDDVHISPILEIQNEVLCRPESPPAKPEILELALDKGKTGEGLKNEDSGIRKDRRGSGKRRRYAPPPGQLPLMVSLCQETESPAELELDQSLCTASDNIGGTMDDELRFSKSKQIGPRKIKVKTRLGQTSKKGDRQEQKVFDSFCMSAQAEGYITPLSLPPNSHIDQRLSEYGVDNVCQAIEFGVKNWGRIKEIFPRAVFAPEPTLRELCLPWVMEGLIPRMRHQLPDTTKQTGSTKAQPDSRSDKQREIDEANKARLRKQMEENKKKYSAG